jgi:catechol 2,3-dioxygenase-like lactoylglutathione lyase family enzyme
MIKGIYEAHLPVENLDKSIKFYRNLELKLAWRSSKTAFFWIDEGESWVGLWEGKEYKTPYHPSLRHLAFTISYEDMKNSLEWLKNKGISAVPFGSRTSVEPFVRPYQGNASVYFKDLDGNSLELMCYVEVPEHLKENNEKLSLEGWEELLKKK